jgi:hypothetical protein
MILPDIEILHIPMIAPVKRFRLEASVSFTIAPLPTK